jgi:protoporphyrinogen oxidase
VGGISRTVERDGYRFDIGGHRFFTKVQEVEDCWHEILPPEDFLVRPRMSRIYYRGKFYDYPLKASNALRNLGFLEAVRCILSYVWARIHPPKDQTNLEGWVAARFGWRLYSIFFKTYNEKLWGVPASEIQSDFAAQRIKDLSLFKAIVNMLDPRKNQTKITSLIEQFEYPKYGPGMMWERCTELVEAAGTTVLLETPVVAITHADGRATTVRAGRGEATGTFEADHIVSSMPLTTLVKSMEPAPPPDVLAAADDVLYRDFLTVALVVPEEVGFPDNWIYIHAPEVEVGRIQNYGQWSPYMVKEGRTCLGLEYFVTQGDELWDADDDDLIALATEELHQIGLVEPDQVEKGYVVRMKKTYPMYDEHYQQNVAVLREWIERNTPNVHPVGRNGMHRYNNQDHSMFTAMLSVDNMLGGDHDVWSVNVEEEYHEEKAAPSSGTGRDAPIIPRRALEGARNTP